MSRTMKAARWTLVNGAIAALVWGGVRNGIDWQANVFRFLFWLDAVVAVFAALIVDEDPDLRAKIVKAGHSVPDWLDGASDMALGIFLAAHGWLGYAFGTVVIGSLRRWVYERANNHAAPQGATQKGEG